MKAFGVSPASGETDGAAHPAVTAAHPPFASMVGCVRQCSEMKAMAPVPNHNRAALRSGVPVL